MAYLETLQDPSWYLDSATSNHVTTEPNVEGWDEWTNSNFCVDSQNVIRTSKEFKIMIHILFEKLKHLYCFSILSFSEHGK